MDEYTDVEFNVNLSFTVQTEDVTILSSEELESRSREIASIILNSELVERIEDEFSRIGCTLEDSDVTESDYMPRSGFDDLTICSY